MAPEAPLSVLWHIRIIAGRSPAFAGEHSMLLRGLRATPALDVLHFPTLDDFRTFERLGDARNTPLSGRCASARAHLVLPSIHLTVQRTFPRILEVRPQRLGALRRINVPVRRLIHATARGNAPRVISPIKAGMAHMIWREDDDHNE
jgi:hypothetical protein